MNRRTAGAAADGLARRVRRHVLDRGIIVRLCIEQRLLQDAVLADRNFDCLRDDERGAFGRRRALRP